MALSPMIMWGIPQWIDRETHGSVDGRPTVRQRPITHRRHPPGEGRSTGRPRLHSTEMSGWNQTAPANILVADDEADTRAIISDSLHRQGYSVVECSDGREALTMLLGGSIDLVVLDLGLPSLPGLDVLADLRQTSDVPVVILSGRGEESDRILGLKLGADDYLPKPFSPRELVARVESVLRRTRPRAPSQRLEFPGLAIDIVTREVLVEGRAVELTGKEFDLLAHLAAAPRRVFSRAELLRDVWASSPEWQQATTVTEIVRRVRQKIEPEAENPRWIKTVRSVGYRFDPEP
jgi:two-component system phosphate regulon response regulator PhoB